jgi:N-acyl amino acid synthase of PEP-CTERM/exosortase system
MYLPPFLDLRAGFSKYFTVVPATTQELRETCFRIRHDVYCRELGFEPVREDGMESDGYDAHSVHCLLRATASGRFVGCIRLILPDPNDPAKPYPFEKTCAETINRDLADPRKMPRDRMGEVSRLAVISAYRRRKSDQGTPGSLSDEDFGDENRPRFPFIPVGLYLGMISQALRFGADTLFMLTEPRLARHLSLLGVKIVRIGGPVEHRGRRVPSMLNAPGIVAGFGPLARPLYEHIAGEVAAGYGAVSLAPPSPENRTGSPLQILGTPGLA